MYYTNIIIMSLVGWEINVPISTKIGYIGDNQYVVIGKVTYSVIKMHVFNNVIPIKI